MKVRILSIDGGGMRGIIPAAILAYLETKIQEYSKRPTAHIADCFDFIAGTSTGSITAACMLLPNEKGKTKYSMNNIVDFYIRLGPEIFNIPKRYKFKTLWGFTGPLIPEENVEKTYLHIFGHHKLKDLVKPVLFPAYDIDKKEVIIYTSSDKAHKYGDFFIKDIIRGTTAVPFIFRPGYFRNGVDIHTIIDGGLIANNPSIITMIEAYKNGYSPNDMIFISLGTGVSKHLYRYKFSEAKQWGKIKWFLPLIDIVKSANIDTTSYTLEKVFDHHHVANNYFRINPSIQYASRNQYDYSKENIQNLLKDAEDYIEENKEYLDEIARNLFECK